MRSLSKSKWMEAVQSYVLYFFFYSVLGWLYEVFLEVVVYRWGFTNRGVLLGPYCPVYGVGALVFLLAFSRSPWLWCLGQLIGWLLVPLMNANLDVVLRTTIPVEMQGRVYACRNSLQFFTIPLGLLSGGAMIDHVCEPWMASLPAGSLPSLLFGTGKGSGAAVLLFLLGLLGVGVCLGFGRLLRRYSFRDEL